ncbi:rad9 domain-containing protein [Ditylenchus destructor]|uniref:Rad9 domain-containing protein n=1 Tax=Ditylenchus destructor TaxID=166010 RepID=A0AAD4RBD1_9BILA|nr:rad9 domain-containing protein [Ditylenchus destructor]
MPECNFSNEQNYEETQRAIEAAIHMEDDVKNRCNKEIYLENAASFSIDSNLNIFGYVILAMSKFSDQLHLEPSPEGLTIKAVNSSKSVFASILLTNEFFSKCDTSIIDPNRYNVCRVSIKSILAVFRPSFQPSQRNATGNKLSCAIQVDPSFDYIVIHMCFIHDVSKCCVIPLRECVDTFDHIFTDTSRLSNCFKLEAKVLLDILNMIGSDADVIKLVAEPDVFTVERYLNAEQDRNTRRKTVANIEPTEFQLYTLKRPTRVAIPVKEFKGVLQFADVTGMAVFLYFDQAEKPLIAVLEKNVEIVAEFVLATYDCNSMIQFGEQDLGEDIQLRENFSIQNRSVQRSPMLDENAHVDIPTFHGALSEPVAESTPIQEDIRRPSKSVPALKSVKRRLMERNDLISEDDWRSQPAMEFVDERLGVFALDTESPDTSALFANVDVMCVESDNDEEMN